MRLISQTGDIDIPYESSTIVRAGELIVAYSVNYYSSINYYSKKIVMGMYSTEEKAKKVMGMLRRVYHDAVTHDNVSAFRLPKDDEI